MNYEVIFNNDYFTSIRLKYGVLINIYKCNRGWNIYKSGILKKMKKIDNYTYELKEDIYHKYDDITYLKGSKVLKEGSCSYKIIETVLNKKDWFWEIKTTSDCFSGNTKDFQSMIDTIKNITNKDQF